MTAALAASLTSLALVAAQFIREAIERRRRRDGELRTRAEDLQVRKPGDNLDDWDGFARSRRPRGPDERG